MYIAQFYNFRRYKEYLNNIDLARAIYLKKNLSIICRFGRLGYIYMY